MEINMEFLKLLEGIRTPFLDWFFSLITYLGDEVVFMVVAIAIFWCINKREGYYVLTVGLVGTMVNQLLKLFFRVPRPWIKDASFKPVESAVERASGYSFPSGHTQNIGGTFGSIALFARKWLGRVLCALIIILVAFSRMYLGVHTPLDVLVSLGIAAALVAAFYPIFKSEERFERFMPFVVAGAMLLCLLYILYFPIFGASAGHNPTNLESGMKAAYTMAGCTIGLAIVYFVDSTFVKFDTHATWYVQLIKIAVGLGVILGIKEGLRAPLEFICIGNVYVARMLRYLLMVIFAGILWPMCFKYLAKIKCKPLDNFALWVKNLFKKGDTPPKVEPVGAFAEEAERTKDNSRTLIRDRLRDKGSTPHTDKRRKPSWRSRNKKNKKRYK